MITSVAAGSTATVVSLPNWSYAPLDSNGFVLTHNMPISSEQGKRALAANSTSGTTWLSYVEDAINAGHSNTQDATNIAYYGAMWHIGDPIWTFIQTTLNTALGSFTPDQLAALQKQAANNR